MGGLPGGGGMLAVAAGGVEVLGLIEGFEGRVSLAAVNGPSSVVVSGELEAIGEIEEKLDGRFRCKRLNVSHAFHSPLMDAMLEEFRAVAESVSYENPKIALVSNVSGDLAGEEVADPGYWVRHVRECVRFADGINTLKENGVTRFLEVGPDAVLSLMASECLDSETESQALLSSTLRRDQSDERAFISFLAEAHTHGINIDWAALYTN